MDYCSIISYLQHKGFKCSQNGQYIIITANGKNLACIKVALSGYENNMGGYNYNVIFATNTNIKIAEKNKVVSMIMDKYGPKKGFSFGADITLKSCDVLISEKESIITLTADMITLDNKEPYFYELIEGFIEKVDKSSLIWNCSEK